MTEPAEVNLWDLADLCTPWCVRVAATLRIANHLEQGSHAIDQLAAAAGCDADVLQRVLGHLASKGVFVETAPGKFALNAAARQLLDPRLQLALDLDGIGGRMAHAWGTLLQFTRTGQPAYAEYFGRPFWDDLAAHPEIQASFDTLIGPAGHGDFDPDFKLNGGWEALQTVVDVGGGTGAMLAEILRAHPHLHGILVDQPATVARSTEIFQAAGVMERVTSVGQSFFDPLPPGADLYLLRGILNDWPDQEAAKILSRCAQAAADRADARPADARPAGRVVILKGVTTDDAPKDLFIENLLLGGKQRTVTEIKTLARQAGLAVVAAGEQPSGYFVVECRLA